jgi:hypothetical protein
MTFLALLALAAVQVAVEAPAEAPADPESPDWGRGLTHRSDGAWEGYTLFAPLRSTSTYLIDMDGEVVHQWASEHRPGNSVYLLDNGHLLRAAKLENDKFRGGGEGGRVQEFVWDG